MSKHRQITSLETPHHPAYVVWELTLKCDHACNHCGSRAAQARPHELSTAEALKLVRELADMQAKEVVLIGGEAYLHDGFLEIISALSQAGIVPVMTTGGMGVTAELAKKMAAAGLQRASVSIDGLEPTHVRIRNRKDSFQATTQAIHHLKTAGIYPSANTHFNRWNAPDLEALYEHLKDLGVRSWQIQITSALGRAADHPGMLFQPWDLINFLPRVAALKKQAFQDGMLIMPGNNLGYFGPEEALLRADKPLGKGHFFGCQAGKYVLGIESDGGIKGCPSLQSDTYIGGHWGPTSLKEIWEQSPQLAFRRQPIELWGFCKSCPFAETCQGGCNFTAHALFGRPGNNPYCHFRAKTLAKQGLRERLQLKERAPGQPFDHGRFELIQEPFDAPDPGSVERVLPMHSN